MIGVLILVAVSGFVGGFLACAALRLGAEADLRQQLADMRFDLIKVRLGFDHVDPATRSEAHHHVG